MTDKQQALRDLLAKVKAGNCHATELPFWKVWLPEGEDGRLAYVAANAYNGSLDAALALHSAGLPGWGATIDSFPRDDGFVSAWLSGNLKHNKKAMFAEHRAYKMEPARAWLIAILKALIAKGETDA